MTINGTITVTRDIRQSHYRCQYATEFMKKPAYKHEVFRQDAVLAPQEPYSEKFRKGTTDIETECLKRRAHFVGVQAGAVAFAGAFGATAIQAFSDIGKPTTSIFPFHFQ